MILRAAWVAPVCQPPLPDACVQIAGQRIVRFGPCEEFSGLLNEEWSDLGDIILTPGLVNPHTHLELTSYNGLIEPSPFWQWLPRLVRLRSEPNQVEREKDGVRRGAWESLRGGVTTIGDISRRNIAWSELAKIPLRKVCFVELISVADHPPRNPDELRAGLEEISQTELLRAGVSPHTPFTVSDAHLRAALRMARDSSCSWMMHWFETREEIEFLNGRPAALPPFLLELMQQCGVHPPSQPPMRWLADCCRANRPGVLAHVNYIDPDEIAALREAGHSVVYCPRAHAYFGHENHPWRQLRAAGINVALGTDSSASNENLALLEEARFLRAARGGDITADALLEMITLGAARCLNWDEQIGSIQPGKLADLAAFPCRAAADPIDALLESAPQAAAVWVAGKRIL